MFCVLCFVFCVWAMGKSHSKVGTLSSAVVEELWKKSHGSKQFIVMKDVF